MYYNVHRWYEVATGRYVSPDPEGLVAFFTRSLEKGTLVETLTTLAPHPIIAGQLNRLYAYADQSPMVFTDPNGAGLMKWLKCIYYTRRCLPSAFTCRQYWREWFRECYANEDYEKIKELLAGAGVESETAFIYKVCFADNKNCQEAVKNCTKPPVFRP